VRCVADPAADPAVDPVSPAGRVEMSLRIKSLKREMRC